jgi:translation initiation factor 5A
MATKAASLKDLRPGHYVIVDNEPCKVLTITLSKPGKHGATKARVDVVGIFDERKRSIMKPSDASVLVPIIEKKKAQVISVSGNFVQLMDLGDYITFDAVIPPELKGRLESGHEVSYWKIGERILVKEA